VFGSKPAYCPQGAIGMAFRGSGPKFNRTTHTYPEGSSLYSDVLGVDTYLETAPKVGIDTVMVWQGQIFSSLLMKHGSYEFNPNSQTLDPHVNEVCDTTWTNVSKTLKANKLKLGWFGRPCSHIMQADGKSPATVTCPGKTIEYGEPVPCNLQNLSDPCTMQSMATVDALIAKGVQNFYWDSCVVPSFLSLLVQHTVFLLGALTSLLLFTAARCFFSLVFCIGFFRGFTRAWRV
jgi:hypothetical protein